MDQYLPLGICKQAVMKLDSALTDVKEIIESDISEEQKAVFEKASEVISYAMTLVYNQVALETDEDEFISEMIDMDPIDSWPEADLMDSPID